MSCAAKSTHSLATLTLIMAVLLSCGMQTPVCGQAGGRDIPKAPPPKPRPTTRPTPPRDNVGDLINRGIQLNKQGDHNAAITSLTEAIRLDSKRAAAYYNRETPFSIRTIMTRHRRLHGRHPARR